MKATFFLMLAAFLAISIWNCVQIQTLQKEIANMDAKLTTNANNPPPDSVQDAYSLLMKTRRALEKQDWKTASEALENLRKQIALASQEVGSRANPVLDWVRSQTSEVSRRVQDHVPGGR